jgi:hypothetical protein
MSENWIWLIPNDPHYVPPEETHDRAKALLEEFGPESEEINLEVYDKPEFFHPGENGEGVYCPLCGEDLEEWLDDWLENAKESDWVNPQAQMPCCQEVISLYNLDFSRKAGFTRFLLEAMSPDVLLSEQLAELEALLGCELNQILIRA